MAGYEWQGDNLLIARENILQTMEDFYRDFRKNKLKLKTEKGLTDKQLEDFAKIISWNVWQMDGLKYIIPMSQHKDEKLVKKSKTPKIIQQSLPGLDTDSQRGKQAELFACRECERKGERYHNGYQAIIKDWTRGGKKGRNIRFVDLLDGTDVVMPHR